ncbi:acyl-CoA N-acyltransferase [Pyrenochaeta sp. MPI-SDFR-AT-0127]|nr:acyl-CoA N-acyltransferase [Pyrenochaeta sp. MPI-SDFR-AT-0127]
MLDFAFHITTPRLYISNLNPSDNAHCDFTLDVTNNAQSYAIPIPDRDAARKLIETGAERLEKVGWGRYLISLKPSIDQAMHVEEGESPKDIFSQHIKHCTHVGIVSMQLARFPVAPTIPDIGFRLHPHYYGKGYATEAASGLMKYYEEKRGVKCFAGFCAESNEASKGVLKRLGFETKGVKDVAGIYGDGSPITVLVWTKGLIVGELEQYGI